MSCFCFRSDGDLVECGDCARNRLQREGGARAERAKPDPRDATIATLTEALVRTYEMIRTRGHIDNHGHRQPGSHCDVCQVVNELEAIAATKRGRE